VGMAAIAGSKVGMALWLQYLLFALSALLCLVEWPWITARLCYSSRIAPAPSLFVHAAPISLVSLVFMEVVVSPVVNEAKGRNAEPHFTPLVVATAHFFFVMTSVGLLLTCVLAWYRRHYLARFVRSASHLLVHQEWSGLTFPIVATSSYAILYAARFAPLAPSSTTRDAATLYADVLGLGMFALVGFIDAAYLLVGMPYWLYKGLPPVPAPHALTPEQIATTGETSCCLCWPPCAGARPQSPPRTATRTQTRTATAGARTASATPDAVQLSEGIDQRLALAAAAAPSRPYWHRNGSLHGVVYADDDAARRQSTFDAAAPPPRAPAPATATDAENTSNVL